MGILADADVTLLHKDFAKKFWRDGVVACVLMVSVAAIDVALLWTIGEPSTTFVYATVGVLIGGIATKFGLLDKKDAQKFRDILNQIERRDGKQ